MAEQVPDILLRVGHGWPVRGIIGSLLALPKLVEAPHVGSHVSVWRHYHGRRPAHDMVARQKRSRIGEAQVVGSMARRRDGGHRPAVNFQRLPILQYSIW